MIEKNEISQLIDAMSIDEMRARLAEYMAADKNLMPGLVAVEIRQNPARNAKCCYDVLLVDESGEEIEVKFHDRYSRLVYIYTLLHPQGYQRRVPTAHDYHVLRQLYSMLYYRDSDALLKTIASAGFDHFLSHYIAQSRKAVRQASPLAEPFVIDRPQPHNGKVLIPFVANGGTVIVDPSLPNNMSNY